MALDPRITVTLRCEVDGRCVRSEEPYLMDFDEAEGNSNVIPGIFNYKFIGTGLANKQYHIVCTDSTTDAHTPLTQENFARICHSLRNRNDIRLTARPRGKKGGKYVKDANVNDLRDPTRQNDFDAARTMLGDVNIAALVQLMANTDVTDIDDERFVAIQATIVTITDGANRLVTQLGADNAA
ncbi:hypothetical protein SPRG_01254 [Saprolegnia parasitica CBS 223.65]|uniref:Uncharacterized protein n=1 Tax=Saprolegnia parasitica (strain CBS 223.65) TaxID=695850 RepID=A0A067CTX4_SAPPC|nr:hypothetical protein SPRG_01254 [Saprolegnia parasitica CBS 223.65]KDO33978.1 hypothetical protein SPRG_01254 [Saprolegnia parasitica CBS 223.65]|eukprot:XP_012194866.1 hypothetical protein SPRG_01254 [Saprolegnia parasitica CBS 223.65]